MHHMQVCIQCTYLRPGAVIFAASESGRAGPSAWPAQRVRPMCRNITTLRGLQPEATVEEIEAAARQYVRKVSGVQTTSVRTEHCFETAVRKVAEATANLLAELPPRQQPPPTVPPLRRLARSSPRPMHVSPT